MDIKDLITELAKTFEAFKAENDKRLAEIEAKGHADPLLTEKVDKMNAEISKFGELKKQVEYLDTVVGRRGLGGGVTDLNSAKAEHAKAFEQWFRKGVDAGLKNLEIQASASTLSDPDGGFLVPDEMAAAIDRVAESVSALRRLSSTMTIGTGTYRKLVNQGGAGGGWVSEKAARPETANPTLVEIAINTKEIYANPATTQTLLDDASLNIEQWLADEVGIVFNEQESLAFIKGNGVEKPKGILDYPTVANGSYVWGKIGYIFSGSSASIGTADKLIDLQQALKSVYRQNGVFLMNDLTQAEVRKMKDGEGNYIWKPGIAEGAPNTLLGKPVEIDDNMDDIGSGKFPIAFADFKRAYLIVDRFGIRVLRDPYTNKPFVHFYTTRRVGGGVVMYEAIKLLKTHTS